jgi:hypothetical protein
MEKISRSVDSLGSKIVIARAQINLAGGGEASAHAGHAVRFPEPIVSGKQFRQDVSDKIHQAVTDHVGGQIAAPEIESGQD